MRVMVTGHTTVVAMNVFKLEAVELQTSLSDHHAWQLTTSLLQGDIGSFSWCILAW